MLPPPIRNVYHVNLTGTLAAHYGAPENYQTALAQRTAPQ